MKPFRLRLSKSIPFCSEDFYELLAEAKTLGFDCIDFDIAGAWADPEKEAAYFEHLEDGMAAVIESGLPVNCIHIPFGDRWNPCLLDEEKRLAVVEKFRAILKRTAILNPFGLRRNGPPVWTDGIFPIWRDGAGRKDRRGITGQRFRNT